MVAVACESNSLQSLSHSSNQGFHVHEGGRKAGRLEWVRKDCFDCIALHVLLSARGGAGRVGNSQSGQFNNN